MNILGSNYLAIEMPNLTWRGRWAESRTCVIIPLGGEKEGATPSDAIERDLWGSALNGTVSLVEFCLHLLHQVKYVQTKAM